MPGLKLAKLSLSVARPLLTTAAPLDRDQRRDQSLPWRQWYKTAEWQRLRWQVLVEAQFTCVMCKRIEGETRNLVADHKRPHRGDRALFLDKTNLQCLCKACHDSAKQRLDRNQTGGR